MSIGQMFTGLKRPHSFIRKMSCVAIEKVESLAKNLFESIGSNKGQLSQISGILFSNIYEIESLGGPLYCSIEDIPEREMQTLTQDMRIVLNRILQIVNNLDGDDLYEASDRINVYFEYDSE